jgi:hypothetical protein
LNQLVVSVSRTYTNSVIHTSWAATVFARVSDHRIAWEFIQNQKEEGNVDGTGNSMALRAIAFDIKPWFT